MKTITRSLSALMLTIALASSVSVQAKHHDAHGKKYSQMTEAERTAKQEKRLQRMAKKLDLSSTQVAEIKNIFTKNKSTKQNLHAQKKQLRLQLKQQRQSNDADANIEATHDAIYALKKQLRQIHRTQKRQIDLVFTPEQRAKAQVSYKKRQERRVKRQGR